MIDTYLWANEVNDDDQALSWPFKPGNVIRLCRAYEALGTWQSEDIESMRSFTLDGGDEALVVAIRKITTKEWMGPRTWVLLLSFEGELGWTCANLLLIPVKNAGKS